MPIGAEVVELILGKVDVDCFHGIEKIDRGAVVIDLR
jgi:hypothetical protein